jgi:hypothetical protein
MIVSALVCGADERCDECAALRGAEHDASCVYVRHGYDVAVTVSYSLTTYEWGTLDAQIERLAEENGSTDGDGGTGFGARDLTFYFGDETSAARFAASVRLAFPDTERVELTTFPSTYDDDDS